MLLRRLPLFLRSMVLSIETMILVNGIIRIATDCLIYGGNDVRDSNIIAARRQYPVAETMVASHHCVATQ